MWSRSTEGTLGFLWNSKGGPGSTRGIYFRNAPDLAEEITDWFLSSCRPYVTSIRDVDQNASPPRELRRQGEGLTGRSLGTRLTNWALISLSYLDTTSQTEVRCMQGDANSERNAKSDAAPPTREGYDGTV
jgi:hypothetical protein